MGVGQKNAHRVAWLTTGQRIRIRREARGMSRPVLAGLVGRSADWLKKIENGDRRLNSLPLLIELARALGVRDISELRATTSTLRSARGRRTSITSFRRSALRCRTRHSDRR
jgi:transcriptional regulator with XRE-family HTH domain